MMNYLSFYGYYGWLAFLYYMAVRDPRRATVKERIDDKTVTRFNWVFALLAFLPLIYMAAVRGNHFGDTTVYRNSFLNSPTTFAGIPEYLEGIKKDKLFYFFAALWHCILGNHSVVYFTIIASIQGALLLYTMRKYSTNLLISLFVFYATTDYMGYMFNGIRQFIAVAIIFGAAWLIFEKKYFLAVLNVLLASLFHQSALLMLPVIFIVQGEPWNKKTVMMLGLSLLAIMYVNQFTNILDTMLEDTQYTNVVRDYTSWNDDGTNPLRVAVYSVPAVLSLVGLDYIREENSPVINICTNMSVVAAGLYLISMVTSGIFLGRLPIYVSLFSNCILLPWEIKHMFNRDSSRIIQAAMIVCFLIFYYYQVHMVWGAV